MAGLVHATLLLGILLVCQSHGYVIKGSSQDSGSDSGSSGSGAPVVPGGSSLGLQGVLTPSYPGVQEAPASSYYSSALVGPAVSSSYPAQSAVPNVGQAAANDPSWQVDPPSLGGPSSDGSAAGRGFEDPSTGFFGPPVPEFTAGELSHVESTFEHGSNDHESEHQGESPRNSFVFPADGSVPAELLGGPAGLSVPRFPGPPGYPGNYWYPYYDWLFLRGQYPPGTVSHFSSSFEQGRDNWRDSHYNKYDYPGGPVLPGSSKEVQVKVGAES